MNKLLDSYRILDLFCENLITIIEIYSKKEEKALREEYQKLTDKLGALVEEKTKQ